MFPRLELRIDNVKVTQNQSPGSRRMGQNGGKFTGCISNLYTGRSGTFRLRFEYPCSHRNTFLIITVYNKSTEAELTGHLRLLTYACCHKWEVMSSLVCAVWFSPTEGKDPRKTQL